MTKQLIASAELNLDPDLTYLKLLGIIEHFILQESRLKKAMSDCKDKSDKQLFSRSLRQARRVLSRADIAIDILEMHGKVYQSSIDQVVNAIDKFNVDYEIIRRRSLEILIENEEEIDSEILESFKNSSKFKESFVSDKNYRFAVVVEFVNQISIDSIINHRVSEVKDRFSEFCKSQNVEISDRILNSTLEDYFKLKRKKMYASSIILPEDFDESLKSRSFSAWIKSN